MKTWEDWITHYGGVYMKDKKKSIYTYEYQVGLIEGEITIESENPPSAEDVDAKIMDDLRRLDAYWCSLKSV